MAVGRPVYGSGEDGMASDGGLRDPGEAALEGSMEVLELFPRYLLKGPSNNQQFAGVATHMKKPPKRRQSK